jgi:hypothetical protein
MTTKGKTMKRPPIEDMYCSAIDVKPIDYDWSSPTHAYGDAWEFTEALTCEKCGAVVAIHDGGDCKHSALYDESGESECDGYIPQAEGPMMSYFYPLPDEPPSVDVAAKAIAHLPVCLVHFMPDDEDSWALALTGGGMDLSWEICEAFMLLGYLPPVHFADLPAMSGRGVNERDRWIASGCLKSCEVAAGWATGRAQRLKRTLADARKRAAAKKTRGAA